MHPDDHHLSPVSGIDPYQTQRENIQSLPAEQALERLLSAPDPKGLVASFPETDLYFLLQEIGFEDAMPILALASKQQWEYLFDVEIWQGDRIDINGITTWMNRIYRADAGRCVQWLLKEKPEFIEYYFFKLIEVRIREHDQDPADFGDEFITLDNVFYVRYKPLSEEAIQPDAPHISAKSDENRVFITKLLEKLAAFDHLAYQKILFEAAHVIPSEAEEEEYRLRNVRLAEKGFVPLEEALGIYHPLSVKSIQARKRSEALSPEQFAGLRNRPFYPVKLLQSDDHLTRALKQIDAEPLLMALQMEFASLCNQLIVADRKKINSSEQLQRVVRKAIGYINLGLNRLFADQYPDDSAMDLKTVAGVSQYRLSDLFSVGYHQVLKLKWRAETWLESCWFAKQGLPLTFWGENWLGVLGGLLLKRPLFFDNFQTGSLYRDFSSAKDLKATRETFEEIVAFDELLRHLQFQITHRQRNNLMTYRNLILTIWARHWLGLPETIRPIPRSEFARFYEALWTSAEKPQKIHQSMKDAFLTWLTEKTPFDREHVGLHYGQYLARMFSTIEEEYGYVDANHLDPRYMTLFLLES